ncbi:RNA 2'-phosphotransferase [Dickeya phage vB_DsoM_AD1]|uniref:Putative RNA NAD 2 n=1 Tax=Dickeya phage vB_DsoM_AD1 TaxID=2283029 RepID=A0A384ZYL6_9CAUD|nr:RNA 2'-phosphotransferase [Dickeya phage vB_DsoM_AD1]AXG67309.1 putative RNA NAD 2 [Dickeya phage vB_DsoM_AD1]
MAKSLGVYLTYILRHKPQDIGIAMDTQGWVSVHELLEKARYVKPVTLETLTAEVESDNKGRFEFNKNKTRIRCVQGHSVEHVLLNMQEWTDWSPLYHGTAEKNISSIQHDGILKRKRKHVHLSNDLETARRVGQRHGVPVVFQIDTLSMITHGYKFYRAENGVILTEYVPSRYIRLV